MTAISDASDGFLGVALALDMTFIDRNGPKEASVSNSLLLTAMRCLVGAVAALPLAVSADVFRVGQTGAACTHRNIQAAINAADANPGADEIRITRDVSTSGEPYWLTNGLTIDTDDALTFSGGWNDCDDEDWQAGFDYQDISGNGFGKPVLQIRGSGEIVLAGLGVTLGEAPAQGTPRAGGIDFEGTGSLYIYTTRIFANTGRLGGGLRVANGQVTLAVNTYIYGNTAITGGGVYIGNNGRLKMEGPYAFITGNVADFGGGLGVFGSGTADLVASDSSLALSGPISGNHATEAGGAISIQTSGAEQQAVVRIASSDPTRVFALTDNSAYRAGAIYVAGGTGGARFCGRNINVSHNISQVGASLMADGPAASIQMGRDLCADLPTPNVECAPQGETRCNRIHENSSGADLLIADSGAQILLSRMRVDHNIVGGAVVNSLTGSPSLSSNITNESSLYDHNNAALLFYAGPYSRVDLPAFFGRRIS